jgi:hypothetical protein
MAESGTIAPGAEVAPGAEIAPGAEVAPPLVVTGVEGAAAAVEGPFSTANGNEVTPEGMPVSVPELIAAVVD